MKTICTIFLTFLIMSGLSSLSAQPINLGAAGEFLILESQEASRASVDMQTAYDSAFARPAEYVDLYSGDIGGKAFKPGVYEWNSDVVISSDIFLESGTEAYWIFNINGTLKMEAGTQILFEDCAQPENVFWGVSGQVIIGSNAHLVGIILAQGDVTLESGASVNGRILSQQSVSLNQNEVTLNNFTELTFTKTANTPTYSYVGQEIWYTIYLYNSGTNTIFNLTVQDPLTGFETFMPRLNTCHPRTFYVKYVITQYDLDYGLVLNTVTAIGVDEEQQDVDESTDELITAITNAELSLVKIADKESYSMLNETITYTISVENLGNITLFDVIVEDPITGLQDTIPTFSPGQEKIYTASYQVSLEDLNNGSILNVAAASGSTLQGEAVEADDQVLVTATQHAGISMEKAASPTTYEVPGEVITYTLTIQNIGNVTLTEISVNDPLTGLEETIDDLGPGVSQTLTTSYTITQEDVDAGSVTNIAAVSAKDTAGEDITADDEQTITAIQLPQMTLHKTASPDTYDAPGMVITYTIEVQNTGNVTLTEVSIEDPLTGLEETIDNLGPGDSQTFTTTYIITQQDLDDGSVMNAASVKASDPNGDEVTAGDEQTVAAIQLPQMTLHKTASPDTYAVPGEVITYTIEIHNTGNVTLTEVSVNDPLTGLEETIDNLNPDVSQTFTTSYIITQEDVDAGSVTNTAAVSAKDPAGEDITASDEQTVTAIQLAQMTLHKTASPDTYDMPGEVITYTIVVHNTGNVMLTEVSVKDPLTGLEETIDNLGQGVYQTFTTSYIITQQDLDNGSVMNAASAKASDPNGEEVTAGDEQTVAAIQLPQMTLHKTAEPGTYDQTGLQINYSIIVENTGNVSINDIQIVDDLTGDIWDIASLAPGTNRTFTAVYSTTQDDLDRGSILNTAIATGKDPQGNDVEATDEAVVTATSLMAGLTVSKTADRQTYENPGDLITYTIQVSNTGNLTITDISIVDDLTGDTWTLESLSPGVSQSYITTYTITNEDLDTGSVINTVVATGKDPQGQVIEGSDEEQVDAIKNPMISITKTASPATYSQTGTQISYTIIVENTGNVTLSDIMVEDEFTANTWSIATLGAGAKETFTTSYTITQGDLDNGSVVNTATVSGNDPEGTQVTDSDSATATAVSRNAAITVSKTSPRPVYAVVGDVVHYDIVVTNTGNISLSNIDVSDDLTRETWFIALLMPGESQTFNTTYTVTQYDLDIGHVRNIVMAYGEDPQGNSVTGSDEETAISIKVPGGLTPDIEYDNILIIRGLEHYPRNTFRIFNRYGTLVYEASPYQNDWVGVPNRGLILTDADGKVPSGTYFYMLVLEPGQKPFSGYIYLIKN